MSEFNNRAVVSRNELLNQQQQESSVETFVRSALYAGIQNPINGAAQLMDRSTGTNLLPNLQFVDAPKENSSAANLGATAASLGHAALMLSVAHKAGGPANDFSSFAKRTGIAAGLGTFYGGVLTPTSNPNFIAGRLENAMIGGTGMAGMSAFHSFYKDTLGKGVSFLDAPPYHALTTASTVALPFITDHELSSSIREDSVFLPSAKLRPLETYLKPLEDHKR